MGVGTRPKATACRKLFGGYNRQVDRIAWAAGKVGMGISWCLKPWARMPFFLANSWVRTHFLFSQPHARTYRRRSGYLP